MEYISFQDYCGPYIGGSRQGEENSSLIRIPCGSQSTSEGGFIFYNREPICADTSYVAYKHFSRNDDRMGLERGALTSAIKRRLKERPGMWEKLWGKDSKYSKFRKAETPNYWIWNFAFYNAEIEELKEIYHLIGGWQDV